MSRKSSTISFIDPHREFQPTDRDDRVLRALYHSPLTAQQLCALSHTFPRPFSDSYVRKRMNKLRSEGYVSHFAYLTNRLGKQKYYKLTPLGYRYVVGPDSKLPHRSYFKAVSPTLQNHTQQLARFIVKTLVSAHQHHVSVPEYYGDKRYVLELVEEGESDAREAGGQQKKRQQWPDFVAQFKVRRYRPYTTLFEIDCGTESGQSKEDMDALEWKVRFILDYAQHHSHNFRHYTLFATGRTRMTNYLQLVREIVGQSQRSLFGAGLLSDYLESQDPLRMPIFYDRLGQPISILPAAQQSLGAIEELAPTIREQLVAA